MTSRSLSLAPLLSRRQLLLGGTALGLTALAIRPGGAQDAVTVTHFLGETIVPKKPQRVVVVSDFTDLEYTLALGVTPVAYGFTGAWARGALPWQSDILEGVTSYEMGGFEPDAETIAGYAPDLIIGMSSYVEKAYDKLSAIAPTIVLDWSTRWRDGMRIVGQALYETGKAEQAIADTESFMGGIRTELAGLGGKKIMIGSLFGETLYIIGSGPIADQFAELGLTFVPPPASGSASGLTEYSIENVDVLAEADILLSFATDTEATARLEAFPLFQRLPAVAGRAYAPLDPVTGSAFADNFSPLSARWVLPRFAELLRKLAAGEGKSVV